MSDVKKTHSALKWMAEKRARLAGDLQRLDRLASAIAAQKAKAEQDLESIDAAIRIFDSRVDPNKIPPIAAQKGRYGKRGGMLNFLRGMLKEAAPESISTNDLAMMLIAEYGLEFVTSTEKSKWQTGSLLKALKDLVVMGDVERLHDPCAFNGEVGRWRWKSDSAPSLAHLRAQAEALGVGVQRNDDDHE